MKRRAKLIVLGSINIDHVLMTPRFPTPGETVTGQHYQAAAGGKGANQAVAASRSGADITFIARVGDDAVGEQVCRQLAEEGIDMTTVLPIKGVPTGIALIFVNEEGENEIGICAGANALLTSDHVITEQQHIAAASALLMQLESPLESVTEAAQIAREHQTKVILNPAPARVLPDALLACINMITPNETEAEILTGIRVADDDGAARAAAALHAKGIGTVIITLGSRGVWLSEQSMPIGRRISGFQVDVADTTAAGDTFSGALVTALLDGQPIEQAIRFAQAAAAITVTRRGAWPSIPRRHETERFLQQQEIDGNTGVIV